MFMGWEMQYNENGCSYGHRWLAPSSQQHACSCIRSHAESFSETSNHLVTQPTCSLDVVPCDFWLFPKPKSTLKGKRFQTLGKIQENTMEQLMTIITKYFAVFWTVEEILGELCEVLRCQLWRGLSCHCPVYNVSCTLFSKCLSHSIWLGTFWTDLSIYCLAV